MPALKVNYVIVYDNDSQIYATANREIALDTPPPSGIPLENKHIYFITHHPDTGEIIAQEFPKTEVMAAILRPHKTKEFKNVQEPSVSELEG